jgi:proteasome assembly chaperone (PAC2) family protein
MTLYHRHIDTPLNRPVLVVALEGWVDAGAGAAGAISAIVGSTRTELLATFDAESLIDQRARRPISRIVDGIHEQLTWPEIDLLVTHDLAGNDLCLLVGPEPDFRWRTFTASIATLASELGVRMAVGLGAFPAPVPHTRPVRLAATVPPASADLLDQIGVVEGTIEVPSGIWGALEHGFAGVDIPTIGLWARVPHYVSGMPFPAASAALIDGLAKVAGLSIDLAELRTEADTSLQQVDELIGRSSEHATLVRRLERSVDTAEGNPFALGPLPTGDELADELERYLQAEQILEADDLERNPDDSSLDFDLDLGDPDSDGG